MWYRWESRRGRGREASTEPFYSSDADTHAINMAVRRITFQYGDPSLLKVIRQHVRAVGFVIMVAEHGERRHRQVTELLANRSRFRLGAAFCEISCDQEDVGLLGQSRQARSESSCRIGTEMDAGKCKWFAASSALQLGAIFLVGAVRRCLCRYRAE